MPEQDEKEGKRTKSETKDEKSVKRSNRSRDFDKKIRTKGIGEATRPTPTSQISKYFKPKKIDVSDTSAPVAVIKNETFDEDVKAVLMETDPFEEEEEENRGNKEERKEVEKQEGLIAKDTAEVEVGDKLSCQSPETRRDAVGPTEKEKDDSSEYRNAGVAPPPPNNPYFDDDELPSEKSPWKSVDGLSKAASNSCQRRRPDTSQDSNGSGNDDALPKNPHSRERPSRRGLRTRLGKDEISRDEMGLGDEEKGPTCAKDGSASSIEDKTGEEKCSDGSVSLQPRPDPSGENKSSDDSSYEAEDNLDETSELPREDAGKPCRTSPESPAQRPRVERKRRLGRDMISSVKDETDDEDVGNTRGDDGRASPAGHSTSEEKRTDQKELVDSPSPKPSDENPSDSSTRSYDANDKSDEASELARKDQKQSRGTSADSPKLGLKAGRKRKLGRDTILRVQMQAKDEDPKKGENEEEEEEEEEDEGKKKTLPKKKPTKDKPSSNGGNDEKKGEKLKKDPKKNSRLPSSQSTTKERTKAKKRFPTNNPSQLLTIDAFFGNKKTVMDMSDIMGEDGGGGRAGGGDGGENNNDGDSSFEEGKNSAFEEGDGTKEASMAFSDDELPSEKSCWESGKNPGGAAPVGRAAKTGGRKSPVGGKRSPDIAQRSKVATVDVNLSAVDAKRKGAFQSKESSERAAKRAKSGETEADVKNSSAASSSRSNDGKSTVEKCVGKVVKSSGGGLKSWLETKYSTASRSQRSTSSQKLSSTVKPNLGIDSSLDDSDDFQSKKPRVNLSRRDEVNKIASSSSSSQDSLSQEINFLSVDDKKKKNTTALAPKKIREDEEEEEEDIGDEKENLLIDLASVGRGRSKKKRRLAPATPPSSASSSNISLDGDFDFADFGGDSSGGSQGDHPPGGNYEGATAYIPGSLLDCCRAEKDVNKVCLGCIEKLLWHHRRVCVNIRKGGCESRRHADYKKGGKARIDLNFQIHSVNVFSDEQHEFVERWLMKEFCRDGDHRQLDHCLRVLQPELFIRIFMDVTNCCYEEAEPRMKEMTKSKS